MSSSGDQTTQESHFDHFVHPMIPTPNPLPVHICGRMPLEPLIESRPRNLFSRIQMIAIGIAAGAAGLLTLSGLYYCYLKRRNRMRSRIISNAAVVQESTKTTNKHLQLHLRWLVERWTADSRSLTAFPWHWLAQLFVPCTDLSRLQVS